MAIGWFYGRLKHNGRFYTNMLTDLEIKLIKEQLKKNKPYFIPQTHNVY